MNAYELADAIEDWETGANYTVSIKAAQMLRQQADRIAELEKSVLPIQEVKIKQQEQIIKKQEERIKELDWEIHYIKTRLMGVYPK